MKLSESTHQLILDMMKKYPKPRSALIPALLEAQKEVGFLSKEVCREIASLFSLQESELDGVISFYEMMAKKPQGRKKILLCKNLSCMLNGADEICQKTCLQLNIQPGETTKDGSFSLHLTECLGACDRAPVAIVDEELVGPLDEETLKRILNHG
jgi:NADH-quinone oxidoreductase subunit E